MTAIKELEKIDPCNKHWIEPENLLFREWGLEVVRLDDYYFAFRLSSPCTDEDWQIGTEDEVLSALDDVKDNHDEWLMERKNGWDEWPEEL